MAAVVVTGHSRLVMISRLAGGRWVGAGGWLDNAEAIIDAERQPEKGVKSARGGQVLRLLPEML